MTHIPIMKLRFNNDDYPYDYELEIWKNQDTCKYYFREQLDCLCPEHGEPNCAGCRLSAVSDFDQFLTIGQSLRWVHTGKADTKYTWHDIDYFNGPEFQKKIILDMRWEELADSGACLPLSLNISFSEKRTD